jgi:hypothetical protein
MFNLAPLSINYENKTLAGFVCIIIAKGKNSFFLTASTNVIHNYGMSYISMRIIFKALNRSSQNHAVLKVDMIKLKYAC